MPEEAPERLGREPRPCAANNSGQEEGLGRTEAAAPAPGPRKARHPQLREDYSFERYVIGENNNFAANAAVAVSRNPGAVYNPFLIYGGVGLGKTHLMQAIGNYAYQHSEQKIMYSTAESFTNEFIQAIRENRMPAFKNKYRFADMLLLDDIHFLENKWETQEELFHTFNALYDSRRHIIFTCDRPASELKKIHERLRSRFERGLNIDLQPPDYETRWAILKAKAQDKKAAVPDEVITLIAENIITNVRDLEAALMRVTAYTELLGKPLTCEAARGQLKDFFHARAAFSPLKRLCGAVSLEAVLRAVADYFSVSVRDLMGSKRAQKIVRPRQITMYIARETTAFSITEIGRQFGGRHYSTVMHACEKIESQRRSDPALESAIQAIISLSASEPP
jgi:chromosomal replication initiator protein